MRNPTFGMVLLLLGPASVALAQDPPAQAPPPPPQGTPLDQAMEPEVVITPRDQGRVKEYRVNGRLYMVEIVPDKGAPYYLIDTDGDGLLDNRQNHLEPDLAVPRWPLLRW